MTQIPSYLEYRIRRSIPPNLNVVAGSTPVVSFGDAHVAKTATLGLNPSHIEFLGPDGRELVGSSRRLATHRSLRTDDLANAPASAITQVLSDCYTYFRRNPYRRWFGQLESILNACGDSYYAGSACHLDLVQWATDPTWGSLRPAKLRNQLLHTDAPFLIEQLSTENIQLLLVNGMSVLRRLQRLFDTTLHEVDPIIGLGHQNTRLFVGEILHGMRVIAWSTNLQSSFGVTRELRSEIANRVARFSGR
ncbi:MAG: hypothetical protein A2Y76_15525 [Planctomycetes bacterium RBG_13_60_9]|nr:MAG: hypothetical protein A2Y76_15525 [Planctomycetes bacterium RBG_13_60_9]